MYRVDFFLSSIVPHVYPGTKALWDRRRPCRDVLVHLILTTLLYILIMGFILFIFDVYPGIGQSDPGHRSTQCFFEPEGL